MLCEELHIEVFLKLEISKMYLEYLYPLLEIRKFDMDLSVKSSRSHKCLVQNISAVGSCKDDHT